ncbi:Outer membrane receptor proteins, mostly Fe transport [Pedobacter westerhofensis]|uniref:Outer membrane receptor proteins, mostly Fe transport n=1 Tax=Pedobacter westerhofensis TaxID=425512 RepID=A0A521AZ77_9SPHI|nr:TonB-dependent receptor [Pedobacter westerhofensis]SMO40147.1 Outer membrane receptor proteins, mostly Fe transport [Pedobacter westerhofensis]
MQFKQILLLAILCANVFFAEAQIRPSTLRGTLKSNLGEPVRSATIKLQNTSYGAISDQDGEFEIKNVKPGNYVVLIKVIGFKDHKKDIRLASGENLHLTIKVTENVEQMETVNVLGRTVAQETNRQAFNVTAIDAKKLYNSTLDISGALDRVAGIRVRESGGVGSNFNLSLNGFSGNHVKYFIDGIPMDNFGTSFQINNIPINIADRIEVYKGVVPMWLGSDALGGAINIVTGDRYRNYLDVSYSYGSFNTHRSVINAAATSKNGLTIQLNAFQNYSDNDYKVKVEASDIYTGAFAPAALLRRFNDKYHNETAILNVGVVDKSYADKLLFGITTGQNYKEIQTGARMIQVFGAWHRKGTIIMPTLKYKKTNLIPGLDLTVNANYNLGTEQNIDTVNARYDWYGNSKPTGTNGGERSRSLYKYKNNNGLATAMANYKISERQSVAVSNVFSTFNRKGSDELNPTNNDYETTKKTNKNVLGLGYNYDVKDRWSTTVFGKYISQGNTIGNGGSAKSTTTKFGYGTAATYFLNKNVQVKASYELTNRMPDAQEIFGDVENQEGNPSLKPEKSNNVNIGASYSFSINKINNFSVNANAIYRHADNFIYNRLNANQSKLVADNRDGVSTWGADADIRYSYKNWLSAGTTVTYQFLRNLQMYEPGYTSVSPLYKDQMPNIPYFFGNTDVSVTLKDVWKKGNTLNMGYNLLYVHAFWLYWPSLGSQAAGDEKRVVPQQFSHDLNFVYSMAGGRYNAGVEVKNITNAFLYDNFSLQKPGRGFYLNLRYFINKTTK